MDDNWGSLRYHHIIHYTFYSIFIHNMKYIGIVQYSII